MFFGRFLVLMFTPLRGSLEPEESPSTETKNHYVKGTMAVKKRPSNGERICNYHFDDLAGWEICGVLTDKLFVEDVCLQMRFDGVHCVRQRCGSPVENVNR